MTATGTCYVCGRTMPAAALRPEWVRTGRKPTGRQECWDRTGCMFARRPIGRRTWRDIDPDGAA